MIYPKEGSALNSNPAGLVRAPWVKQQASEAAGRLDQLPPRRQATARVHEGRIPSRYLTRAHRSDLDRIRPGSDAADEAIDPLELEPAVFAEDHELVEHREEAGDRDVRCRHIRVDGRNRRPEKRQEGRTLPRARQHGDEQRGRPRDVLGRRSIAWMPAPLKQKQVRTSDKRSGHCNPHGGTALYDAVRRAVELSDTAHPRPTQRAPSSSSATARPPVQLKPTSSNSDRR